MEPFECCGTGNCCPGEKVKIIKDKDAVESERVRAHDLAVRKVFGVLECQCDGGERCMCGDKCNCEDGGECICGCYLDE